MLKKVVATVQDEWLSSIDQVADGLRNRGMRVDNVLATAGIITGEILDTQLELLQSTEGVIAIEEDSQMEGI